MERPKPSAPALYTVHQVHETLNISVRQVWRLLAMRELTKVKAGRATRITAASVQAFINRGGVR